MNVWIFNEYAASPHMAGSTRHFDCARRLVRRGWHVTIFSGIHGKRPPADVGEPHSRHVRTEILDGVRFAWISAPGYRANDARRLWSMVVYSVRALRAASRLQAAPTAEAPDVVVGSSVHLLASLVGWRMAERLGIPFVLELRDLWPQSLIEMGALHRWHPFAISLRALEGWLVRRAARIVVLSERTAEYLIQRGAPRASVVVVPNGIDLERAGPATPVPERDSAFRAVYLGAHGVANRLDVILEAARMLKERGVDDVQFAFVGGGYAKTDLESRAQALGLTNVEFLPSVAKERVPAVLAEADALLLTEANNVYGSSNKLNDYLAAGRPILFSTFAGHNVAPGCGMPIEPGNAAALADGLIALRAMSSATRAEMGACARRFAETHRSWDVLAERFAHALDQARLAPGRAQGGAIAKRSFDLLLAIPLLIVCAAPLGVAAALLRLEGGGPAFFRQERVGRGGRPFRMWKLRTMTETRIAPTAPDLLSRDDVRITRVGRILRSLGFDELPQLLNVLAGDMSLVGPRPALAYQASRYTDAQRRRLETKPGITSLAVVSGRNALSWEERIALDVWYVDHRSLGLDLRILLKTLWKVLVTREGLYASDGPNDPFVGSGGGKQEGREESA